MSFNTHLFLYEHKNVNKEHIQNFFEIVAKYTPDIICFQEFTSNNQKEDLNVLKKLQKDYQLRNYFSLKKSKKFVYSNTISSKYPIIKGGSVFEDYPEKELPKHRFIYADLKIGTDTIRVYNVHFSSFHLDEQDKAAYEEIVSQQKFDNEKGRRLFGKLSRTMKKHGEEVKILLEHIDNSPYKKIVCGDFNDTPASYAYQKLSKRFNDTYRIKGKGIGKTYNGLYPAFRIDYIFSDKSYSVENYHTIKTNISDHYPILATIQLESHL
ncbi:endonuclease/exonuclease/phosphatase family protein [Bacteroidales bacterium OttesenSCG-928-C19]|nr:endonuclease/exonuclease/phosphatase family protein [Bacteroidales bacterium OttesenSCG-928-C19]